MVGSREFDAFRGRPAGRRTPLNADPLCGQRETKMAKHDVQFEVPARSLGRADVKFLVKRDGAVIGTLTVSNGSVVWFPKATSYGYKVGWKKFDELMQERATRTERR